MSSSDTPFHVPVDADVETLIVGPSFTLLRRELGTFSGFLAPGIYKFKFLRGTAACEQLVEIPPGSAQVMVTPEHELELDSAVPLSRSKRSSAHQVSAARTMSQQAQAAVGQGSSIYVFVRNDADAPPRDPAAGFSLHALDDSLVADIATMAVRDDAQHPTCAAFNLGVNPGAYRLRYDDGQETLEQMVIASANWQTQVFLVHRAAVTADGSGTTTHPLANASVLMCSGGFDPDDELVQHADSARIALSLGRVRMPHELLSRLLNDKFESPMLGVYAAHAIAAGGKNTLLDRVLDALESTIPNHPDVAALRLSSSAQAVEIEWPPMLRSSWNAIIAATLDGKASLCAGSLASRLPTSTLAGTPWLVWSVGELLPVEATAPRDVTADLDNIRSMLEQPLLAELTGWEEAIYSYLQRRTTQQREGVALESLETNRLDARGLARAFGTTVGHVQATVAGLAAKLKSQKVAASA